MKTDPPFSYNTEDRKRQCKNKKLCPVLSHPRNSECFPTADRNENQAWMNQVQIPRGTRAVLGPSQYHTAVQSCERLQNSHRAAVQLPTQKAIYLAE